MSGGYPLCSQTVFGYNNLAYLDQLIKSSLELHTLSIFMSQLEINYRVFYWPPV